jgi:bifunctional UDP-N-acetylglucosamine pyrophosphorylase/glucosamine-1-phosphate N-acetyltransferase
MNGKGDTAALILAAGEGTRMKSDLAKVLHAVAGESMIRRVLETVKTLLPTKIVVVVGHQADAVRGELEGEDVDFALQEERLGTGHAAMIAEPTFGGFEGTLVVLNGDTPLLRPGTLERFVSCHRESGNEATVLSAVLDRPTGYGRIVRSETGDLVRIVEEKDASDEERLIGEINSGIFCFECPGFFDALKRVDRRNVQGEYYITDVMEILGSMEKRVGVFLCDQREEVLGINDRDQLLAAERLLRENG